MGFKLKPPYKISTTPVYHVDEEDKVLGRANKDGTMDIKPGLSAEKRKKVIAHEQVHLDQFKSGKLDYTDSDITWKGQKIPRTADSKIFFNGKLYIEGAKNLPWEKEANKLSKNKV